MVLIRLLGVTPLIFAKVLACLGNSNSMDLAELEKVAELVTAGFKDRRYSLAQSLFAGPRDQGRDVEIAVLKGRVGEIILREIKTT
jgi:hypothetical protein